MPRKKKYKHLFRNVTRKYVEVLFKCKPVSFRSRVVCGGETVALACPPSQPDFRSSGLQYFYHYRNLVFCTRCIQINPTQFIFGRNDLTHRSQTNHLRLAVFSTSFGIIIRLIIRIIIMTNHHHRLIISDWPFFPLLLEQSSD